MAGTALFFVFAGFAIMCAISMVYHRNPLYSAISLVGVFISLSCIYIMLAAPFIAAVQILIYAGAIMVLVVFVIMLLNLDADSSKGNRLRYLWAVGGGLGVILLAQTLFVFYAVMRAPQTPSDQAVTAGKTLSIGQSMYTEYLLPVEIVGVLLLMAVIGAVILSRRLQQPQLELVVDQELERRNESELEDGALRVTL